MVETYSSFYLMSRRIGCCWLISLSVERAAFSLCCDSDAVFQRKPIFWRLCGETPPSSLLLLAGLFFCLVAMAPWHGGDSGFFFEACGMGRVVSCDGKWLDGLPARFCPHFPLNATQQVKRWVRSSWRDTPVQPEGCAHTHSFVWLTVAHVAFPQGESQAVCSDCQTFPCISGCFHKGFKNGWKVKYAEAGRGWRLQLLLLGSAEKRLRKPLKHLALSCLLFYGWKSDKMFWIYYYLWLLCFCLQGVT